MEPEAHEKRVSHRLSTEALCTSGGVIQGGVRTEDEVGKRDGDSHELEDVLLPAV